MFRTLKNIFFFVILVLVTIGKANITGNEEFVQAQVSLTVSESKRLIAKAIVQMPIVQDALTDGMVIIARGTTNSYVAEEILNTTIEKGTFVTGKVYPKKGGKRHQDTKRIPEFIIVNGKIDKELSYADAVTKLQAGDVMIKGANALDYNNKVAGVNIGSPTGGTTGKFMPYVVARKAYLVIPVGLEKLVTTNLVELSMKMREPLNSLNNIPSMFLLTGEIVTEIEALEILTGVTAFQSGAGGIGGAEGGVRLIIRGTNDKVENALNLLKDIYGEPPFIE